MPAFRTAEPSVAPDDMTGTTTTPGQKRVAVVSIALSNCGGSGDGGDSVAGRTSAISTAVSAMADLIARTTIDVSVPGIILQFTVA